MTKNGKHRLTLLAALVLFELSRVFASV